jgi:hypothetical protein
MMTNDVIDDVVAKDLASAASPFFFNRNILGAKFHTQHNYNILMKIERSTLPATPSFP